MTNLAIKGILAIRTMAEISKTLGATSDYNSYSVRCLPVDQKCILTFISFQANASSMVAQWQNLAGSTGHLTSTYSSGSSSWGLMYNLYPDKLFGFNFVNESVSIERNWDDTM